MIKFINLILLTLFFSATGFGKGKVVCTNAANETTKVTAEYDNTSIKFTMVSTKGEIIYLATKSLTDQSPLMISHKRSNLLF